MPPTKSQGERLLSIGEAAARLGLSVDTLRAWDRDEGSPLRSTHRTLGRQRRYSEAEVEALREKRAS